MSNITAENNATDKTQLIYDEDGGTGATIIREFDAPRERVFKAMTDANDIPKWWGPAKYAVTVDVLEPHHGGRWRFVTRGEEGEFNFRGVFHIVEEPSRIVQTFEFEGAPGFVNIEQCDLEDLGNGRCRSVQRSVHLHREALDAMIASGMETGMRETMNRLAALVEGGE